jgi:hypothetical protein
MMPASTLVQRGPVEALPVKPYRNTSAGAHRPASTCGMCNAWRQPQCQALAGLVAGSMLGALTAATFAVVDNVWLDVVAQQQSKINGFAHSDAGSMQGYIDEGLIGVPLFPSLGVGVLGAALSWADGLADRQPLPPPPIHKGSG